MGLLQEERDMKKLVTAMVTILILSACSLLPERDPGSNFSNQDNSISVTQTSEFVNLIPTTSGAQVEITETVEIAASPTASPTSGLPPVLTCYTDSEILTNFGFQMGEVIRTDAPWDSCKWNRQTTSSLVTFTLPVGWGLTYTDANGSVWVTVGKGQKVTARGFTLRQYGNQFLVDSFTYFQKEWDYGYAPERGTLTYAHCPDKDFYDLVVSKMSDLQKKSCPVFFGVSSETTASPVPTVLAAEPTSVSATSVPLTATAVPATSVPATSVPATSVPLTATAVPATAVPPTATPVPQASGKVCPSSTGEVAALVGGSANMWTPPDWSGGAWVFRSGGEFINLTVPTIQGSNTWIDYWNGSKGAPDKLNPGQTLALNEASFHCHSN